MFGRKKAREKQKEFEQEFNDVKEDIIGLCEWTEETTNLLNEIFPRLCLVEDLTQAIAYMLAERMKAPKKERKPSKKRKR